jgi:serine/threonine protein kinase
LRQGSDFETYDAWSEARYSRCVLKTIRADRRNADNRERLRREGRLLTTLDHPHLVRGYELMTRPRLAVAMETLTGVTLSRLFRDRRLPPRDVAHLGGQLSSALRFLHDHAVLHLDVKPGNITVDAGRARLFDLSLAQAPGRVAAGLGTADYLAPEQGAGGQVGEAADVWGLGLTLYVAATGANPFHVDAPAEYPQLTMRAPQAGTVRRMPRKLALLLDACLEPEPSARPTMAEIAEVCAELCGYGPPAEPAADAMPPRRRPTLHRGAIPSDG